LTLPNEQPYSHGSPRQLVSQPPNIRGANETADKQDLERRFAHLVAALSRDEGVTIGGGKRGFGDDALQVNGKIFAMVSRGHLVLKLPGDRVSSLLARGDGLAFDAGKGRPMKEWVAIEDDTEWEPLAREAEAFAAFARKSQ
jgi:hypothetical protein